MEITFQQIKESPAVFIEEFGVHALQDKCCILMVNGARRYLNEGQRLVKENDNWIIK